MSEEIQTQPEIPIAPTEPIPNKPGLKAKWRNLSKNKKLIICSGLVILLGGLGVGLYLVLRDSSQPPVSETASNNNESTNNGEEIIGETVNEANNPEYETSFYIGQDKKEIALKRVDKQKGDDNSHREAIEKGEAFKYQLLLNGSPFYSFTSKNRPNIVPFNGNDERILLSKYDNANQTFYTISLNGNATSEMTEPDDLVFFIHGDGRKMIARNNDKMLYSAISVQHTTCGGDTTFKIPDIKGPTFELRAYDFTTGEEITIIKDQRKPVAGQTEEFIYGLRILGYSADGMKVYVSKDTGFGCGGPQDAKTYEVVIASNGAIKEIPYKETLPEDGSTYPNRISDDGQYLYYDEVGTVDNVIKEVFHRYEFATGTDIIVSREEAHPAWF